SVVLMSGPGPRQQESSRPMTVGQLVTELQRREYAFRTIRIVAACDVRIGGMHGTVYTECVREAEPCGRTRVTYRPELMPFADSGDFIAEDRVEVFDGRVTARLTLSHNLASQ